MSDASRSPRLGSKLAIGIFGGLVGSALTALLLIFAAPQLGKRMVRQALIEEPRILVDASNALRDEQYAPVLAQYRKDLETPYGSSWKGSANPDIVLVEFFDYACGYCRASNAHVDKLIAEDAKLRVVYREFPILGEPSVAAARLSLAASRGGRFKPFYDTLFKSGRPGPETLDAAATAAGLPLPVADDASAEAELKRNYQMANQLGASGTPLFIVGDKVLNGAVGYEALKTAIAEARAAKG